MPIFAFVNKLILFLLFPVMIFNSSLCEVLKTPQLVLHYLQHHERDQAINFVEFLEMHYLGQDQNDGDEEEDMKLPFKKIDGHHVISMAVPSDIMVVVKSAAFNLARSRQAVYNFLHINPTTGSLFRPPIFLS